MSYGPISLDPLSRSHAVDFIADVLRKLLSDWTTALSLGILILMMFMVVAGAYIAPYQYDRTLYTEDGQIKSVHPPSLEHPLGTTYNGMDVLSRILYGARATVLVGLTGGLITVFIGSTIGIISGYKGGRIDSVLMRITDMAYGVPELPFAIVMVALFGASVETFLFIVAVILWRSMARVFRSQVLQIKQYPFVESARAIGTSDIRIIYKHILPNVGPMVVLFFALGTGYTILMYASLSFLGMTNPFLPAWGVMIKNAFSSGYMTRAVWWSIPPGVLIAMTVWALFMFGRGWENLSDQMGEDASDEALVGGG